MCSRSIEAFAGRRQTGGDEFHVAAAECPAAPAELTHLVDRDVLRCVQAGHVVPLLRRGTQALHNRCRLIGGDSNGHPVQGRRLDVWVLAVRLTDHCCRQRRPLEAGCPEEAIDGRDGDHDADQLGRLNSERRNGEPATFVVIDRRGWLRLPDADRDNARLGDRAQVTTATGTITISGLAGQKPADEVTPTKAVVVGATMRTLTEASFQIGETVVLQPTSTEINGGQLHAITGRSGSGKTTVLALITGWLQPTSGSVHIDSSVRVAACAAVPVFADDLTVSESLSLTARIGDADSTSRSIASLLDDLGLSDLSHRTVSELSGGERQRLAIGRCLASGATLLVFDESTAQLDRTTAHRIIEMLVRAARSGKAVVCATHDAQLCARADRITQLTGCTPDPTVFGHQPRTLPILQQRHERRTGASGATRSTDPLATAWRASHSILTSQDSLQHLRNQSPEWRRGAPINRSLTQSRNLTRSGSLRGIGGDSVNGTRGPR